MKTYDVIRTPVGTCTVAMEGGRIVRVRFGGKREPGAKRARLSRARRWVKAFFEGRSPRPPMVAPPMTPFARRVAAAVRRIPPGRTLTYGQVARRAGRPGAARAVGGVMGRNTLPLFVP